MIDDLLSQEELEAVRELTGQAGAPPPREVHEIDLVAQDHQVVSKLAELQRAAERLLLPMELSLGQLFAKRCPIRVVPVEILPGSQLEPLWRQSRYVFGLLDHERRNCGSLAIDALLGETFILKQFGGSADVPASVEGPSTPIERATIGILAQRAIATFVSRVETVAPLGITVDVHDDQGTPAAAVVVFALEVDMDGETARLTIALDTAASCFQTRSTTEAQPVIRRDFERVLDRVNLVVSAILGERSATTREVLGWRPGDVFVLDSAIESQLKLRVAGKNKFLCKPVTSGGTLSVSVSTKLGATNDA